MNVALPSIRHDLGFSVQGLQWVLSGYLITYGGLVPLGGRASDLLGRGRLLVAGTSLFAACWLVGGLAANAYMLVGARPNSPAPKESRSEPTEHGNLRVGWSHDRAQLTGA
jgi:MFS family permease